MGQEMDIETSDYFFLRASCTSESVKSMRSLVELNRTKTAQTLSHAPFKECTGKSTLLKFFYTILQRMYGV